MNILSIESSCDETGIALLKDTSVVSSELITQINKHKKFGGVVPELASRLHTESIHFLIEKCLKKAELCFQDINLIGVTKGPGLEGALLIGQTAAKSLSTLLDCPVIGVNHLHGHLYAAFLDNPSLTFPFMCLIVSGGHTQLVVARNHYQFELIGQTRDDAAGEAFDKIARYMELGYPGGPIVEKLALDGDPLSHSFPQPMLHQGYEFSFSGLKTAVIQTIDRERKNNTLNVENICASFQHAVFSVLSKKIKKACNDFGISNCVITGGVAANQALNHFLNKELTPLGYNCFVPSKINCTDNAAMIGLAAYHRFKLDENPVLSNYSAANLGSVNSGLSI
ncbi:tRNA (adenosine(37)-N6)-threonylcarbamoyltransferase complex transferase subunit TsaD [bacterium]|nr:tRNA (adenosine(37)-N6)-threonylcarbamoyltransferase complex transferase subunit TsaD [bacterium]